MDFHLDARAVLRRATELALTCDASAVNLEYFLCCDPSEKVSVPFEIRDIPFSPQVQHILEKACILARNDSQATVRKRHLQTAVLAATGNWPAWSVEKTVAIVADLLEGNSIVQALRSEGVDVDSLRQSLSEMTVRDCRPDEHFMTTEAGRLYRKYAERLSRKANAAPLLFLFSCLLCRGPAAQPMLRAGLTPDVLVEILEASPEQAPVSLPDLNFFGSVSKELSGLSPESCLSLDLGWRLRDGPEMGSKDLLRGLMTSDPTIALALKRLSPSANWSTVVKTETMQLAFQFPMLSPQVQEILALAREEAGSDQMVSNQHLLIALAEWGSELLTSQGITAKRIREALTE